MELSIITLNYNKPHLTIACLQSIHKEYKKEFEENLFECIVVDNASQDNSSAVLKREISEKGYKNVHLIESKKNGGFGAGNNLGVKKASGKYVVFLNNDAQVLDRGLSGMLAYLDKNPKVAILGGQLHNADNSLQASAGAFYTPVRVLLLMLGMQRFGILDRSPKTVERVDWVKGAVLMMRKDIFAALHGFDEKIFMYTEDMELCYRAHLAGYETYFYPDILVIHSEHGSGNRTFAIVNIYKNLLYFYKKHRSKKEYNFVHSVLWTKSMILVMIGKILHNKYLTGTYEKTLAEIR